MNGRSLWHWESFKQWCGVESSTQFSLWFIFWGWFGHHFLYPPLKFSLSQTNLFSSCKSFKPTHVVVRWNFLIIIKTEKIGINSWILFLLYILWSFFSSKSCSNWKPFVMLNWQQKNSTFYLLQQFDKEVMFIWIIDGNQMSSNFFTSYLCITKWFWCSEN